MNTPRDNARARGLWSETASSPVPSSRRAGDAAFTLVEAMVVVMIISVVMGLIVGLYRHAERVSKTTQARTEMGELSEALATYYLEVREYPVVPNLSATNLLAEPLPWRHSTQSNSSDTFSTLLPAGLTAFDPWERPYQYLYDTNATSDSYRLYSLGPDGEISHDDILIQD